MEWQNRLDRGYRGVRTFACLPLTAADQFSDDISNN